MSAELTLEGIEILDPERLPDVRIKLARSDVLVFPASDDLLKITARLAGIQRDIQHAGAGRFDDGHISRDACFGELLRKRLTNHFGAGDAVYAREQEGQFRVEVRIPAVTGASA